MKHLHAIRRLVLILGTGGFLFGGPCLTDDQFQGLVSDSLGSFVTAVITIMVQNVLDSFIRF